MEKSLIKFWHWLTTSRLTRLLEFELERARTEIADLKRDNDALTGLLYPQLKAARKDVNGEKKELPASMSWNVR